MNQDSRAPVHVPRCHLEATSRFIDIVAHSGYRGTRADREAYGATLSAQATDAELGHVIRQALRASSQLRLEDVKAFFELGLTSALYEANVERLMKSWCYDSRSAMFKGMRSLSVELRVPNVRLLPTRRSSAESWVGLPRDLTIEVPADSSDEALGAAARAALLRSE